MALRVMQVVYALSPGGSEMLASAIAKAGMARGIPMSICALHRAGSLEAGLRAAGVRTHVIDRPEGLQPKVIGRMYRLFRRERATVVLTHHLGQLLYSAVSARIAGARLVHVEHEFYTLASMKARRCLRAAARLAERIIGVSEEIAEFLVRKVGIPSEKVMVIRNGVDVKRFTPPTGGERAALGVPDGVPVFGTLSRLDPVKDHFTLLAAFRLVVKVFPAAVLVIIGDGEMRVALEERVRLYGIQRNVTFLGERVDVSCLLPGLDVFVLSSIHEGLSMALLEAMACARPVVVTDVGAAGGLVGAAQAGIVVPPRNPAALAEAMMRLAHDKEDSLNLGLVARRLVETNYNLEDTVSSYLAACMDSCKVEGQT